LACIASHLEQQLPRTLLLCDHPRGSQQRWVGLKNEGSTCWLACNLQLWFHVPALRRAVLSLQPGVVFIGSLLMQVQQLLGRMASMPVDLLSIAGCLGAFQAAAPNCGSPAGAVEVFERFPMSD
jgi:hypothetical protein